jgi:ribonuclease HI
VDASFYSKTNQGGIGIYNQTTNQAIRFSVLSRCKLDNVTLEKLAIKRAVKLFPKGHRIILSDCAPAIRSFYNTTMHTLSDKNLRVIHIKAHAGYLGNEMADYLAKSGARMRISNIIIDKQKPDKILDIQEYRMCKNFHKQVHLIEEDEPSRKIGEYIPRMTNRGPPRGPTNKNFDFDQAQKSCFQSTPRKFIFEL